MDGNELEMDTKMDSGITNTGVSEKYTIKLEFVSTQRGKQKLVQRKEYSTLKRTNHIEKCWICASPESCAPLLYTNQDATQVIRNDEHTDGCRVNPPTFYYQQQLNELKQLVAGDLRPVNEIYDELANNAYIFSIVIPGREHIVLRPCPEIPMTSGRAEGFATHCSADNNKIQQIFNVPFDDE
ncbi:hypothetical protein T07_6677 [Trichinella nelsoni]|uniref:FLYWCH-type domain-containing protein n=1 Tax=Trichinella nelsoni TaxID=6336 RepID=A0A0V0S062_9BILA|nr:hypothetical protein T07_6677 [Trichinella nelsoni]